MTTETITTTGAGTWVCPAGVTSVAVECWGAGKNGNPGGNFGGGIGGNGGGYAKKNSLTVTPGNSYSYFVGAASAGPTDNDTWFSDTSTVLAYGGANAGNSTPGVGDVTHLGGTGASGGTGPGSVGGGGGSSAGPSSDGNGGSSSTAGSAVTGGGAGGNGGASGAAGSAAASPGGGGGGGAAEFSFPAGGAGGSGQIVLTYSGGGGTVFSYGFWSSFGRPLQHQEGY